MLCKFCSLKHFVAYAEVLHWPRPHKVCERKKVAEVEREGESEKGSYTGKYDCGPCLPVECWVASSRVSGRVVWHRLVDWRLVECIKQARGGGEDWNRKWQGWVGDSCGVCAGLAAGNDVRWLWSTAFNMTFIVTVVAPLAAAPTLPISLLPRLPCIVTRWCSYCCCCNRHCCLLCHLSIWCALW